MVSHHAQSGVVDAVNQAGPDIGSHGRISGRPRHIECPAHEVRIHSEAEINSHENWAEGLVS